MDASLFGKLNFKDIGKGLLIAVATAVLSVIYATVQTGSLIFDWQTILTTAVAAALAYLFKNVLTNSDNQLLKKEQPKL